MIKNEIANHLNNLYRNIGNKKNEAGGASSESAKKGKDKAADTLPANASQTAAEASGKNRRNFVDAYERSKDGGKDNAAAKDKDTAQLSPEEKRQAQLKRIMEKIEAEEAARYPNRAKKTDKTDGASGGKKTDADASASVVTTSDPAEIAEKDGGIGALLNDMPLFNEFKTSLMDAFRQMDSTTKGSISAQYELNVSSMKYIADAAGNYQYQETSFNLKLDLNYVKAGAGGMSGSEIADALEKAEDFESFVAALQTVTAQGQQEGGAAEGGEVAAAGGQDANNPLSGYLNDNGKPMSAKQLMNNAFKNLTPDQILNGLQDYFSPENTAGRIVDFATAFFPMSEAYKKYGDTEEARKEFGEMMRGAIDKGFSQAMGALGSVPKNTQEGIDKTHELAMKGLDDFIKNGVKKEKEQQQDNLRGYAMSVGIEMSYSQKTVSVSGYGANGQAQTSPQASSINTEA